MFSCFRLELSNPHGHKGKQSHIFFLTTGRGFAAPGFTITQHAAQDVNSPNVPAPRVWPLRHTTSHLDLVLLLLLPVPPVHSPVVGRLAPIHPHTRPMWALHVVVSPHRSGRTDTKDSELVSNPSRQDVREEAIQVERGCGEPERHGAPLGRAVRGFCSRRDPGAFHREGKVPAHSMFLGVVVFPAHHGWGGGW